MSDLIGNLLTSLRNAQAVGKAAVVVPYSKTSAAVVKILAEKEFIKSFAIKGRRSGKVMEIELIYDDSFPRIKSAKRVSKLGKRIYKPYKKIQSFGGSFRGVKIVSTPKGMMTGSEAVKEKVGGEVICEIR